MYLTSLPKVVAFIKVMRKSISMLPVLLLSIKPPQSRATEGYQYYRLPFVGHHFGTAA